MKFFLKTKTDQGFLIPQVYLFIFLELLRLIFSVFFYLAFSQSAFSISQPASRKIQLTSLRCSWALPFVMWMSFGMAFL